MVMMVVMTTILKTTERNYYISSLYEIKVFPFQNNPRNLDPSSKTDLFLEIALEKTENPISYNRIS